MGDSGPSEAYQNHRHRPWQRNHPGGGLPDRWIQYTSMGTPMSDLRLIAFKTPLSTHFFDDAEGVESFTIPDVVNECAKQHKRLGLVIDLTNTNRYCKAEEWSQHGVKHVKIRCPGHEMHALPAQIGQFMNTVLNFLNKNRNQDLIIGVHCTHGVNRTGYLICRYLIECCGWSATSAIEQFERHRRHKIERDAYTDDLHDLARRKGRLPPLFSGPSAPLPFQRAPHMLPCYRPQPRMNNLQFRYPAFPQYATPYNAGSSRPLPHAYSHNARNHGNRPLRHNRPTPYTRSPRQTRTSMMPTSLANNLPALEPTKDSLNSMPITAAADITALLPANAP